MTSPGQQDRPDQLDQPDPPRYEPPPSVGKLALWIVLFLLAAIVVVLGGVYLT